MSGMRPGDVLSERDPARKRLMIGILAQQMRIDVLTLLNRIGTGHWGGSSSAAELTTALYFHRLRVDPRNPTMEDRDRFVMSKGHAAPLLYAVLARRGFFPPEELQTLRALDSRLQGHPCMTKTPGVDMSTGALGHGLSVGLGMALASRLSGRGFWTYVMTGEGCLNEGQTWEAVMASAKFRPPRLVLMVDYNRVQLDGPSDRIMPLDPLYEKFRAFNWTTAPKVYDGHNVAQIMESFDWLDRQDAAAANEREGPRSADRGPSVIVYDTRKAKGVSFMEGDHAWHGGQVTDEAYHRALPELREGLERLEAAL